MKWYFGRFLKGHNQTIKTTTRPNVLFLWNAANLNHPQLKDVYSYLRLSIRVISAERLDVFKSYSAELAKGNERAKESMRHLLEVADVGISDFEIREESYTENDIPKTFSTVERSLILNQKRLDVYMQHPGSDGQNVAFKLEEESNGTRRLFAFSGILDDAMERGYTLFVDELDASLHPLIVRYLVEMFHNPMINKNGAQLIFNSHDTTLMDNCLFRRDQIWFVEKDRQGSSHLYPLLDYQPRKGEALAKGYLMGRYGAIPFISEPHWGDSENEEPQA